MNLAAFLLLFAGTWSGAGEGRFGPNDEYVAASCEIEIEWRGELRSHGVCESNRGRFSAGGALEILADGTLGGTFMRPFFVETAQSVAIEGGRIVVRTVYDEDGVTVESRVALSPPAGGVMVISTSTSINGGPAIEVSNLRLVAQ
jgi:hypothetical protein